MTVTLDSGWSLPSNVFIGGKDFMRFEPIDVVQMR